MTDITTIEQVKGGFILAYGQDAKDICSSLDELFDKLLMHYEGRSELFYEDLYGSITINRKDPKQTRGDER